VTASSERAGHWLVAGLSDPTRQLQFKESYAEHLKSVFKIVLHVTNDPDRAEDYADEAFTRLFQHWDDIDPAKRRAWVVKVAINEKANWWRAQGSSIPAQPT
jgi:DNA-directed RNA polymerase specialized sigma24 family protein